MESGHIEKTMKEKLIIDAAQKRFGLFGLEKTSMREIADDLNLSKASLYYYFPDKESLYKAVVEKEQTEFLEKINSKIDSLSSADDFLKEYASSRLSYFRTLVNLSRIRLQSYSDLKPLLKDTLQTFRDNETRIIVRIIKKGIDDGLFHYGDENAAAELFLDLLKGLRMAILNDRISQLLGDEEYEIFLEKTNAVTDIFIRGLKYKNNVSK